MMRKNLLPILAVVFVLSGCLTSKPREALPTESKAQRSAATSEVTSTSSDWPTGDWLTSTPEEQGMDGEILAQMLAAIKQQNLELHSMLVIRHGRLVSETYFGSYTQKHKHELYSCTKSFVATLVGIALEQGKISGIDEKVVSFFPDKSFENSDERKQAMTLENLLTMTSGLTWEDGDPAFRALYTSSDWVKHVMDLPMSEAPGERFNYCSGCSHVLSGIIRQQTGLATQKVAEEKLFAQLGIKDYAWSMDATGNGIGGWGLQLTPRQMAKLGYLYLHQGNWDGQQLVPAAWVEQSTQAHVQTGKLPHTGYGYQWWVFPELGGYAALGLGGQTIFVAPELDLVVVTTAKLDGHEGIFDLLERYILPAARQAPLTQASTLPTETSPQASTATLPPATATSWPAPSATPIPQSLALRSPAMQGPEVSRVQQRLLELGYVEAGQADGVFTANTDAAVRHFQYLNGLEINGAVDDITRLRLFNREARRYSLPPPFPGVVLREGVLPDGDQALHSRLATLKYIAQDEMEWIQNRFGAKTRDGVQRFQKANGLESNGMVDMKTWQALFSPWAVAVDGQSELPRPATDAWQTNIFPMAGKPLGLAYDGQKLWVAHSFGDGYSDNFVLAIDPKAGALGLPTPVMAGDPADQEGFSIGGMLFVKGRLWLLYPGANSQTSTPAIRTLRTDSGVTSKPFNFGSCPDGYCFPSSAFGFDGNLVWASVGNRAVSINPSNFQPGRSFEIGFLANGSMVFDGNCMWMRGEAGLTVFNVNGGRCAYAEMAYSLPSDALAFDGKRLWIADTWSGTVTWLDVKLGMLGEPIQVGGGPTALAFDGKRLWIANSQEDSVVGMDVQTEAMGEPLHVGAGPVALLYDGQRLWVACSGSRSVQAIDPQDYFIPVVTPHPTLTPTITPTLLPELKRTLYLTSPRLEGNDVLALQKRLIELGYTEVGQADGIFGPQTEQAVRHFQEVNGLVVDGIVGPQTWAALFSPTAKVP